MEEFFSHSIKTDINNQFSILIVFASLMAIYNQQRLFVYTVWVAEKTFAVYGKDDLVFFIFSSLSTVSLLSLAGSYLHTSEML